MSNTKFCRWDAALEAEAGTYKTAADDRSQIVYAEMFSAPWYPKADADGKWIVPLFAPPYQVAGLLVEETPELAALRQNAEIVGTVAWPEQDEE